VISAFLAVSACARSKPAPSGAETPPVATSPVPKPKSPAPQPPPCDDALVDEVARGAAPLGALWTHRCGNAEVLRAVMSAQTTPRLTGFVTERRRGSTVVDSFTSGPKRVSWQGTCVERIEEAFPGPNQEIPPECLQDAEIVEQTLPPELEDMRADHLLTNPVALRRWRTCRQRIPAETCLDRLLPLKGGGSSGEPGIAGWIKARDIERRGSGALRRKTCRLTLVDPDDGRLAFRCRGTLVDSLCSSRERADQGDSPLLCSGHEMVEIAKVDAPPSADCLESARMALRAPPDLFADARSAALAACSGFSPKLIDDQSLDAGNRLFFQRLLARQEALFGPVTLPPRCTDDMRTCVEVEEGHGDLARVIAQGCGNQIWAIEEAGTINVSSSTGDWGGVSDDRRLVRLPVAAKVREPNYTVAVGLRAAPATFYIVDTTNEGNEFDHHYQPDAAEDEETHPEAELIEEDCVTHQGSEPLCAAYAWGDRSVEKMGASDADRARVQDLLGRGWPRAFRRLQRWQRELADGARLASYFGQRHHEICARLLIDACTGDLGEVCTSNREDPDGPPCDGELLPDGRCRRYRFARLPLQSAQPPAR
jgi:hypothetical protein